MSLQKNLRDYLVENHFREGVPSGFDDAYDLLKNGILDSLAMIGLMGYIEMEYQIIFDDQDLLPENFKSINALAELVQKKQEI